MIRTTLVALPFQYPRMPWIPAHTRDVVLGQRKRAQHTPAHVERTYLFSGDDQEWP
jgi:hypothetical protein